MKIEKLEVTENESIMYFQLSCEDGVNTKKLFDLIAARALSKDEKGWCDVNRHYDIRLDGEGDESRIIVREKNNPVGHYGHSVVLKRFPADLMSLNIIDYSQMRVLDGLIKNAEVVKAREAATRKPAYMTNNSKPSQ